MLSARTGKGRDKGKDRGEREKLADDDDDDDDDDGAAVTIIGFKDVLNCTGEVEKEVEKEGGGGGGGGATQAAAPFTLSPSLSPSRLCIG